MPPAVKRVSRTGDKEVADRARARRQQQQHFVRVAVAIRYPHPIQIRLQVILTLQGCHGAPFIGLPRGIVLYVRSTCSQCRRSCGCGWVRASRIEDSTELNCMEMGFSTSSVHVQRRGQSTIVG
jgi:hypothetical protein